MLDRSHLSTRTALTARFRDAWKAAVAGIIGAGQVIIDGKRQLPYGEFLQWVEADLQLGERKAQMLMLVAKHPVIADPNHWYAFPPSWRTLYELTALLPPRTEPQAHAQAD